jgi:hypothetical protein
MEPVFPPEHPLVLVALCGVAGALCVPLYQLPHVGRLPLLCVLGYHAALVQYVVHYNYRAGGRAFGTLLGLPDVLLLAQLAWVGVRGFDAAPVLRGRVWTLASGVVPLLMVPQVVVLLALAV